MANCGAAAPAPSYPGNVRQQLGSIMTAPISDNRSFSPALSFHPGTGPSLIADSLPAAERRWTGLASGLISLAILAVALFELRGTPVAHILSMVPRSWGFWVIFLISYITMPASEWVIYRRLWSIPPAGFAALLRKRVANEVLLGYLGEVYFYAWVRRTGLIRRGTPFGAIKDVAILSALAGNAVTLAMLATALPFLGLLQLDVSDKAILGSLGVLAVTSFAMLLLRKRLFTLPRGDLQRIAAIHLARILIMIGLTALMWHLVLPAVSLVWWLLLSTLRQLLSRLPLVPNKDLAFVGLAIFVVGRESDVGTMIAMIGGLVLLTHLVVGSALGAAGLIRSEAA